MGLIAYLIGVALSGLIVGAIARLLVPGPDPMGIGATILLGIAASFIAGLILWGIWGPNGGSFIISVLIAIGLVLIVRRSNRGVPGPRRRF